MSSQRLDTERAHAAGRIYASLRDQPPCSKWLEELGFDACRRQYFLSEFKREKESWPLAKPVDLQIRECRCAKGCQD